MDERERGRQRRYREAMRNRVIAVVFLAALIVGIVFIVKGCRDKKQEEEERRQQAAAESCRPAAGRRAGKRRRHAAAAAAPAAAGDRWEAASQAEWQQQCSRGRGSSRMWH